MLTPTQDAGPFHLDASNRIKRTGLASAPVLTTQLFFSSIIFFFYFCWDRISEDRFLATNPSNLSRCTCIIYIMHTIIIHILCKCNNLWYNTFVIILINFCDIIVFPAYCLPLFFTFFLLFVLYFLFCHSKNSPLISKFQKAFFYSKTSLSFHFLFSLKTNKLTKNLKKKKNTLLISVKSFFY